MGTRLVRWLVGRVVLALNWMTWPRQGKRNPDTQTEVNLALANHALYQFAACPFCVRVRRAMQRLNLPIELRDARNDPQHRQDLAEHGGRIKAPCLRIDHGNGKTEWIYESKDIIAYLSKQFPLKG